MRRTARRDMRVLGVEREASVAGCVCGASNCGSQPARGDMHTLAGDDQQEVGRRCSQCVRRARAQCSASARVRAPPRAYSMACGSGWRGVTPYV